MIIVLKATLLLVLAWAFALVLRNASAATRHFVWCAALFGCAVIAATAYVVPAVKVPVWTAATPVAALTPVIKTEPVRAATGVAALQTQSVPKPPVLPMVWFAGFAIILAWSAIGQLALARIARRATAKDGYHLSDDISAPVTWGSMILLPREAEQWPDERITAALLHERAHIARNDFLTQTLARLVCALFWFHPLVWLALRRLRAESEHACDDRVLTAGMAAPEYASHLLAVAQGALARRHGAVAAIAMARPSQFESRLVAVLDDHRSRGRTSKRIAVAAMLLATMTAIPIAASRTKEKKEHYSGPSTTMHHALPFASGETLTLDLETGAAVQIQGSDESQIKVESILGGRDKDGTRVSVERVSSGVRVSMTQEGRGTFNRSYSTSHRLVIRAPRQMNLKLDSAGGGLTLSDLDGTFRGSTGGGEIVIERAHGRANLSTGGGTVDVSDSDLNGTITTGGGGVSLVRVRGGLNATSGSGPVIKHKDKDDGRSVHIAGGPIDIGAAEGLVEASTGGGPITIGPVAGSVRAGTGAGNMDITLTDAHGAAQFVDLHSGTGTITVHLPANFDGRFELETAYTASVGPVRIDSDWNLAQTKTTTWDDTEGTPRRYVRARGVAGSGRGLVRIKTVNGNVVVKRTAN